MKTHKTPQISESLLLYIPSIALGSKRWGQQPARSVRDGFTQPRTSIPHHAMTETEEGEGGAPRVGGIGGEHWPSTHARSFYYCHVPNSITTATLSKISCHFRLLSHFAAFPR